MESTVCALCDLQGGSPRGAPGGPSCQRGAATPGPIPNPEVKRPIAESTAVQSVGGQDAAGPSGGPYSFWRAKLVVRWSFDGSLQFALYMHLFLGCIFYALGFL